MYHTITWLFLSVQYTIYQRIITNYMILYDCLKSKVMKLGEPKNLIKLAQLFAFYFCFIACNHYTPPYCTAAGSEWSTFSRLYSYIYKTGGRYCYNHALETFLYIVITSVVSQESPQSAPNVPCQNIQ